MIGMRFLFSSAYSGLGGGETIQLNLAEELVRRGMEAQLIVREEGEFAKRWRQLGQKVHIVPFRPASVYFLPFFSSLSSVVRKMADIIQSEQIQIAHGDYHSLPYLAPAAKRVGVPRIWICMGWWFHPKPWQRGFFRKIERLYALSNSVREGFFGTKPFADPQTMCVLHPGIHMDRFSPFIKEEHSIKIRDQYGSDEKGLSVLHVGRFQDVKGHDTFQEIALLVTQHFPKTRFIVAGENLQSDADNVYQQRILQMAKNDPILNDKITYVGYIEEMQQLYNAVDVAVCPSRFESYGMANLEAMACGVPVVSTNRGGPSETIVEGVTGFLVPPRDTKQYADRILRLLEDPELRQEMGAAGRRHVEKNFSIQRSTDRFLKHCERLLS